MRNVQYRGTCLPLSEEELCETCSCSSYNLSFEGVSMQQNCLDSVHLCPPVLIRPLSIYIYIQDHVSLSAVREYRPAFCI